MTRCRDPNAELLPYSELSLAPELKMGLRDEQCSEDKGEPAGVLSGEREAARLQVPPNTPPEVWAWDLRMDADEPVLETLLEYGGRGE